MEFKYKIKSTVKYQKDTPRDKLNKTEQRALVAFSHARGLLNCKKDWGVVSTRRVNYGGWAARVEMKVNLLQRHDTAHFIQSDKCGTCALHTLPL